jgi:hypothetical protein
MLNLLQEPLGQGGAGVIAKLPMTAPIYRTRVLKRTVVVSLLLAAAIGFAIYVYRATTELSPIAQDLTPAWTEMVQSHAATRWHVDRLEAPPVAIPWYTLAGKDLTQDAAALDLVRQPSHCLYYLSSLRGQDGWTGLFFWRTGILPSLSIADKSHLVLIIEAQEQDFLEIGLKDVHRIETKVPLPVMKGWAGYRIPLVAFVGVDAEAIKLVLLAHTRGVGSKDTNLFRIALIGAR